MTGWMGQPQPPGHYRTWTCGCGRLGLALAVEACPDCGTSRDGTPPDPAAVAVVTEAARTTAPKPPTLRRPPQRKPASAKGARR